MVSRNNLGQKDSGSRKNLLLVLFILLVVWYIIPRIGSQVTAVAFKNQYFKVYREFSQAVGFMQERDEFNIASYADGKSFTKNFASFFTVNSLCKKNSNKLCLSGKPAYATLDGNIYPQFINYPNIGQFVLGDDALVILNNIDGNLWINVDINGIKKGPNRLGLDVFTFYLASDELNLRLMGASGTPFKNVSKYCDPLKSSEHNGLPCSYKAILDKDYFHDMHKYLR